MPILRRQGLVHPDLPGFLALGPPRRTGRGRAQDKLVMHLALQGNAPLSPKALHKLLDSLGQTYFKSAGSSTAAMRVVAESLNQSLFSRNQRGSSRGMRSLGIFSLAVFRNQFLFLAQCGSSHALLVQPGGLQHFHDPSVVGRGLGMGRATPIQYHHAEVTPGSLLIISPSLPPTWNQSLLRSLVGKPLGEVADRLFAQVDADLEAVMIQIEAGSGEMRTLQYDPTKIASAGPQPDPNQALPDTEILPAAPVVDPLAHHVPVPQAELPPSQAAPVQRQPQVETPPVVTAAEKPPVESTKTPKPVKPKREPVIGPAILAIASAVGTALRQFFRTIGAMIRRVLPDEKILDLPPSAMLFGALAVPLIIVSVASVVYLREGRGRLHQEKLLQAQTVAEQALPLEDPIEIRAAWEQVLVSLDEAENYGSSQDSQDLRTYAYSVLDNLDIVERLDYQAGLVGGIPSGVTVKKIVLNADNELYLLNGENGYVLRATYSDKGYELDAVFNCGPVAQPFLIGPLIDIAALPRGQEDGATILGMDANGNLLRCIPGEEDAPIAIQMAPPDLNWGQPTEFALENGNVYVLDSQTNSVWVYWANDNFSELPTYYFGNQIPPLKSVIDMSVKDGDLYLLHDDGHITVCNYSSYVDAPTRCTDPAEFIDLRAGYQNGSVMQGTNFQQMQLAPPPDPSLYLFDPQAEAVYHLSMRLAFQRQYRPSQPLLGETATTFAVGPNRQAFVATNEQVYVAIMP